MDVQLHICGEKLLNVIFIASLREVSVSSRNLGTNVNAIFQ